MHGKKTLKRTGLLGLVTAMALGLLAACGSPGGEGGKPSIGFIEGNWTSHIINRVIAEKIVTDQLEYPVHRIPLDVTPGWAALCNEEVHIGMEAWLPSRLPEIQPFIDRDCVEMGGSNFIGAIGWFVPSYLVEGPNAPAPDLKSITDLNNYWQLFENRENPGKGELMGGEIGWIDQPQDMSRIAGYELNYYRSNQSEPVLLASVKSKSLQQEPFLTYLWTPHFIFGEVDLVRLDEPDVYVEGECFERELNDAGEPMPYRCPHPEFDVRTAMNANLKEIAPDVYNLINNFNLTDQTVSEMLLEIEGEGRSYEEVADEWIAENQDRIDQWIAGNRA